MIRDVMYEKKKRKKIPIYLYTSKLKEISLITNMKTQEKTQQITARGR